MLFGYTESLDYSTLPGYDKLTESQQKQVHAEYERAYHLFQHMGVKIAMGRAHETAKAALDEQLKTKPVANSEMPPSIFAGLENCQ